MIKYINFHEDIRTIKKDTKIEFKNQITVITGDNGSGKSTILHSILTKLSPEGKVPFSMNTTVGKDIQKDTIQLLGKKGLSIEDIVYIDSVSGLLKNLSYFDDNLMDIQLASMHQSSGEGLLLQLANISKEENLNEKILILDEPERGLSIKQQFTVAKYLGYLAKENEGLQIIVVSHGYGILTSFTEVYSTNTFEYTKSIDYISSMIQESL